MTEIEALLIESLKALGDESAKREQRLTQQLIAVESQLQALQQRVETLNRQVVSLSRELAG